MRYLDDQQKIILSASDITQASACQWALMRRLDVLLGHLDKEQVPADNDPMLERAARAGDLHESRLVEKFRAERGADAVVELPRARSGEGVDWVQEMERTRQATLEALRSPAEVVAQAAFFDGDMVGYADFVVKTGKDDQGRDVYEVWDAKLALHVKITALLQLAAYSEQLEKAGIAHSPMVSLVLGDQSHSTHDVRNILPTYRRQKALVRALCDQRMADTEATYWGDPRYVACGRCVVCAPEVERTDSVLLTFGVQKRQADLLHSHGISTLTELAALDPVQSALPGMPRTTLANLASQASVQLVTRRAGTGIPVWRWRDQEALAVLPEPSPGDVFFDFEGDPLDSEAPDWGIDYLFGVWADNAFTAFWADTLEEERQRFDEFIRWLLDRLERYPDLHVYHYAPYERTHLLSLARRHDLHIDTVDNLLRQGVLFDLYPMVRRAVRIGQPSYSIKKLEPLYMEKRNQEGITAGDDSVTQYVRYRFLRADALTETDPVLKEALEAEAATIKTLLLDYNRDDCYSTELLRNWLRDRALEAGVTFHTPEREEKTYTPTSPLYYALRALVEGIDPKDRHPLENAGALAASALGYYRLERQSFWWEHITRLTEEETSAWPETRGTVILDQDTIEVTSGGWSKEPGKKVVSRRLSARGEVAPGTSFSSGSNGAFLFYRASDYPPIVAHGLTPVDGFYVAHNRLDSIEIDGDRITLRERLGADDSEHDILPVAIAPSGPFCTTKQRESVFAWARRLYEAVVSDVPGWIDDDPSLFDHESVVYPTWAPDVAAWMAATAGQDPVPAFPFFDDPAFDVVLRTPPRSRAFPGDHSASASEVMTNALVEMGESYLAVQGPPGTGKTHTGSAVIRTLVIDHGWRVGVVAQSHKTVENVLEAVLDAGVPSEIVGKKRHSADTRPTVPWTDLRESTDAAFPAGGCVIGGTAWDFSHDQRFADRALDLLVIDEAGQFSLANTIAVSRAASRLLLLGDPQQLPEVTMGTHGEPVNTSALGWLSGDSDILPPELGVFLPDTWRMGPELCEVVSDLSYQGRLESVTGEKAPVRHLEGVTPGLTPVPVAHEGNSVVSTEEAERVVDLVRDLLGRPYTDSTLDLYRTAAPLGPEQIIIVAAYNAQVQEIQRRLEAAGLHDVPVGTVDKFQGRQAAVAIVSLAASSAKEVPRGIEFLLMRNRLNVAISRAKWASFLVHSPAIGDHLPTSVAGLESLSGFLKLVEER